MAKLTPEERRLLLNGASEPHINVMDYTGTLALALNYYNVEADSKRKRGYAETYAKRVLGLDVSSAPDYLLNTIGAMCRLISRNEPITETDIAKTHEGLTVIASGKLRSKSSVADKVTSGPVKPKRDPAEIIEEIASAVIEDVEYAIDELVTKEGAGGSDFNVKSISVSNPKAAKVLTEYFENRLALIEEARTTTDADLKEGYSNINRRKMNHLVVLLSEVVQKVKQSAAVVKVRTAKPRKEKPAHVLVSKMKYKAEDTVINAKSVDPKEIIGASEVVVFNTKYRRLAILKAVEGSTLSVKGSTVVNIDPTTSVCKTLRKPEEQLKDYIKQSKRFIANAFKAIKSTERLANGRMNEDTLIIMVNK